MRLIRHPLAAVLATLLLAACAPHGDKKAAKAPAPAYQKIADGVIVPVDGSKAKVRLQLVSPTIVHVTVAPDGDFNLPASLMAVERGGDDSFGLTTEHDHVQLKSSALTADVDPHDGRVQFLKPDGSLILAEKPDGRSFTPVQVQGKPFYEVTQRFASPDDEAFYGMGQHQNRQMNLKGEDVELAQHNMDVGIPFVVSTRDYGVLWDNNAITRFGDPRGYKPLGDQLALFDADGKPGGFTARYYVGDKLAVTRNEADIDYAYIKDLKHWPAQITARQTSKVVWEGSVQAKVGGTHKFRLYSSSYAKVWLDGKLVYDDWRQNWNPWYHNLTLDMAAGSRHTLKIEWKPNEGYLAMVHLDPQPDHLQQDLAFTSELAHAVDYTFVSGRDLDEVIAGYRTVTGKAVMLPRWAYGFWQSRERYKTQAEILDTAAHYRKLGLPLDNIVEDWSYWPEDAWGSHDFDASRFPDPKGMIAKLHAMHLHFMISVWPKFYPGTANYKELDAKGYIYRRNVEKGERDWIGKGYLNSIYDPYAKEARDIYWRQIRDKLYALGVDAWWLDASEPDIHSNLDIAERKLRMGPTAMGPGAAFFNAYPLMHTTGVYQGQRASNPDSRVFILTRSAFAGQQRNAAATWSGDVASRWSNLHDQISAGVNFSLSGIPNWTTDIGGFALEDRYMAAHPKPADLKEWRELNLRWFQFGAFSPLFRSHGQFPYREIYNLAPKGSEVYDALVWYDKLRYRLMPYIYTLAADTFWKDGTIMRGLAMDFPADTKVRDIDDEYLFGPAFLVAPVTTYGARSRSVYLPAGADWIDYRSGRRYAGGQSIEAEAPLSRMPLFVRVGSIVPTGPDIQYTGEKPDAPITLDVYTGADGSFSLYDDDGTSYGYEQGHYSRVPLHYDEASHTLHLGAREGDGTGAPATRRFVVHWVNADGSTAAEQTVDYDGSATSVVRT